MKKNFALSLAIGIIMIPAFAYASSKSENAGKRAKALDNALWNQSEWISVANAPVVTGPISGTNERAADGAGWFVSTVKNDKKVTSARWMTTGLGVYDLFVNGKTIGD